ncbi:cell adhesion molecule CEACAM7-like isoform X2 [Bos indicus]|uniref:Cell adhesion molecule CEACAM7-like isoform X2 n=1 Tax=Bos indicus TaxID=9915 RepID=A0ABM4QVD6_BOSIN
MGTPSGPPRRRCIPWNRLLLAVSLLTFWTPPTTAQLTTETVPPLAAEGSDVLLLAHNVANNPLGYAWYRGERVDNSQLIVSCRVATNLTIKGPAHSGREALYPNGTLLIQNVTQKDTGSYMLLVTKDDLQTERQTGQIHVHPVLPTPVITSNNSKPWEHKDTVVLTCGPETQNTSYMWWISNQSLPKSTRLKLSEDKRTLTVFSVTRKEKGPYVCETRNLVSISRSDPFTLDVLYPVARPSLQVSNTTVPEHEGPVVLTCLTDETGVSIRWLFKGQSLLLADRMTLSSDNSTLTIDPISREDAGDYQCEVSNRGNSSRSGPLRLRVTSLTSVYTPHKYACFSFLTPAACTTEGTGPQRPPQDVVPLAALPPRPPYLMPGHQLPSTRNYYTPTQTFTVISATKQMRVLSSSRHVSLRTVRKSLPETQDPSEVKRKSLRQRTSSET